MMAIAAVGAARTVRDAHRAGSGGVAVADWGASPTFADSRCPAVASTPGRPNFAARFQRDRGSVLVELRGCYVMSTRALESVGDGLHFLP